MRFFGIIISLILCLFIFAGCGAKSELTPFDISSSLKELSPDTVSWATLDKSSISTYFGLSSHNISSFSGYINDAEERFDMIAIFEYEDEKTKEDILSGIASMAAQMSENYKIANANEATKINAPTIAELDNMIILCIMDKQEKITDYLENEIKAEIIS